jgi:beta-aspartyl-peptidase (threonine type)
MMRIHRKNNAHRIPHLALLLVVLATAASTHAAGPPDPDDQVQAVRALLDRQVVDWNKGDLDAFLTGYWNSPKVVFLSGGQRHEGFDTMRARYRRRYQAEGKEMGRLDFSELEFEPLGPKAVMARGRWRLTMSDGSKPAGLFTLIVRKLPEGWKIIHDHTSAEDATPTKPAARPVGQ